MAYTVATYLWVPIRRVLGWLMLPLGQAALYSYIVHFFLILLVYNLAPLLATLPGEPPEEVFTPALQIAVVLLLWVLVRRRVLFGIIRTDAARSSCWTRTAPPGNEFLYLMRQTYGDDFLRGLGAPPPQLVAARCRRAANRPRAPPRSKFPPCARPSFRSGQGAPLQEGFFTRRPAPTARRAGGQSPHPNVAKLC